MTHDSDSRSQRLNQIIAEYLESVEGVAAPDRGALLASHSDLADDLRLFFMEHDRMRATAEASEEATLPPQSGVGGAATLPPLGTQEDVTLAPAVPSDNTAQIGARVGYFGDYELLEEIARGGMGVVYKARQVSLNRIVALKMILAGQLAGEEDVQRFQAEAEAAANLDHPGIVPIFEIGEYEGQHYFSMGYVDGPSLADRVKDGPLPPRDAADYTRNVAKAVAFAHEHGVVHRDLKPSNILLDREGQTKVTDFGLAKRMHAESDLTGTGQILGTPSYMAPEQASGKTGDMVGPPADIYALGAILYCLSTGRPPFQAASPMDTILQVMEREPVFIRQLNSQVPRDLETIAHKCLAKNPLHRYHTVEEVVEELQRFDRGLPILARPVIAPVRLWRWCRRQPVVATLLATVVLLLVSGTSISTGFALSARSEAEEARTQSKRADEKAEEATHANTLAQMREREAKKLVDDWFTAVSESREMKETPNTQPLRRKLLERALEYYSRQRRQPGTSRATRRESVLAYLRVAAIRRELSQFAEALAALDEARTIQRGLTDEFADYRDSRILAIVLDRISLTLARCGQLPEAAEAARQALEIRQQHAEMWPDMIEEAEDLAASHHGMAGLLWKSGKLAEAAAEYEEARAICRRILSNNPNDWQRLEKLGLANLNLTNVLDEASRVPDAIEVASESVEIFERLQAQFPANPEHARSLAAAHRDLGVLLPKMGRVNEGKQRLEEARAIYERLARENPSVPLYTELWASLCYAVAVVCQEAGEYDASLEAFGKAASLRRRLVRDNPDVAEFSLGLAATLNGIGVSERSLGHNDAAIAQYRVAVAIAERLVKNATEVQDFTFLLASVEGNLAIALHERPEEALPWYERAVAHLSELTPDSPVAELSLAQVFHNMANLLRGHQRADEALEPLQKSVEIFQRFHQENPSRVDVTVMLGGSRWNLGLVLRDLGRPAEAVRELDRAIGLLQPVTAADSTLAEARGHLLDSYKARAPLLLDAGRRQEALADWDSAISLSSEHDAAQIRELRDAFIEKSDDP